MTASDKPAPSMFRMSHFGIAVSDIERSTRFYCGALDFAAAETYEISEGLDVIMEMEDIDLRLQFLRRPDVTLELLYYNKPEAFGPRLRRPLNQHGLTHMSFWVDDLEAAMAKVRIFDGHVHASTRATVNGNDMVYCTDPDGVRIELMRPPVR